MQHAFDSHLCSHKNSYLRNFSLFIFNLSIFVHYNNVQIPFIIHKYIKCSLKRTKSCFIFTYKYTVACMHYLQMKQFREDGDRMWIHLKTALDWLKTSSPTHKHLMLNSCLKKYRIWVLFVLESALSAFTGLLSPLVSLHTTRWTKILSVCGIFQCKAMQSHLLRMFLMFYFILLFISFQCNHEAQQSAMEFLKRRQCFYGILKFACLNKR